MADACSLCATDLITDAQFEALKPEPASGPSAIKMTRYLEMSKARDSIGVTCEECGASFCVKCMQEHGNRYLSSGGLACVDCGGALTTYRPRATDRDGNRPPRSREAIVPPVRVDWQHSGQTDFQAEAISPMLVRLPVLDQATGARKRAVLAANPGRRTMFSGPREHTARFVSQMVDLTKEALQGIPELERVDITLLIIEDMFQINYIQNWANGAVNAYGEEVIRTGEDVFEVFGGSKSAARMEAAWDH